MSPSTHEAGPLELLSAFEDAVHARQQVRAFDFATELVHGLCSRWLHLNLAPVGYAGHPYPVNAAFCERFAAAWATLLLADDFDIRTVRAPLLLRNLQMLHLLVQGTADGTLDTAIRALNARMGGKHTGLSLARVALLWVPGSRLGLDIVSLRAHIPQIVAAQTVASVAALVAWTPETHAARENAMLALTDGRIGQTDYDLMGISNDLLTAWMRCSYSPAPRAHAVKTFLNSVIDRGTPAAPPLDPAPVQPGHKPVMVVPLDSFASAHAMYRCYGPVLAACRRHFTLVALARRDALDAQATTLFDRVHDLDAECAAGDGIDYGAVMRIAAAHRPALVFFPSVGMRTLTATLALRRLAPVQVMTYGHPATTLSPVMDYGILETQWIVDSTRYSERILPVPRGTLRYTLPPGHVPATRDTLDADPVVRVAIPSIAAKWTQPFIAALQQVAARTGARAEFHFFSGVTGISYAAASNAVHRLLANAVVHPALPYDDYCRLLARCHVQAGSFPFGGTNSIIDSLLNGLPIVCMAPEDARGAQDADFIDRAGLPSWLVARDVPSWIDTLAGLINDRARLAGLRAMLADRDRVRACFMAEGKPEHYADTLLRLVAPPTA